MQKSITLLSVPRQQWDFIGHMMLRLPGRRENGKLCYLEKGAGEKQGTLSHSRNINQQVMGTQEPQGSAPGLMATVLICTQGSDRGRQRSPG